MNFEGGAYIASGKFKCLFDNQDFVEYLRDKDGSNVGKMRCLRGKATIIAEEKEFNLEQAFARTLHQSLSPPLIRLAYAAFALIPNKRYDLSEDGVQRFQQISRVSSQPCKALFQNPTKLQVVCMSQGIPLSGATIIPDIWSHVATVQSKPTMVDSALLITEYLCNVCVGLKLLLDANLLHGDIKVNNVLLYPNPQPIRRYELPSDQQSTLGEATDMIGCRLRYQLIDFGKHQTRETFLGGGYRVFTSQTMRPWYNPLCLGFYLLDKEASLEVSKSSDAVKGLSHKNETIDSNSETIRNTTYKTKRQDLQVWLPKLFYQIDKYAFMYILWQTAYSSNVLHTQYKEWDATAFNSSLLALIQSCAQSLPNVAQQALKRISGEAWLAKSIFRKYMMTNSFVWFTTWDEIYARVWVWGNQWGLTVHPTKTPVVPNSLRSLATFASPSLEIQPLT
jgi:hypothetical protein